MRAPLVIDFPRHDIVYLTMVFQIMGIGIIRINVS